MIKRKKMLINVIIFAGIFIMLFSSHHFVYIVNAESEPVIVDNPVSNVRTIYYTTPGISEFELLDGGISVGNTAFCKQCFLPFDAKSAVIVYEIDFDVKVRLKINDSVYDIILSADAAEYVLEFSEVLRHQDISIEIISDSSIIINRITFNKANVTWIAPFMRELPHLTQFEEDISTSLIFDVESPILMVNGSKRYIDYDEITSMPKSIRGNIYLPVKALARAIGMYYEDYPELTYILMRSNDFEIAARGTSCTLRRGGIFGREETVKNPFVYINGKAYAPVRKISEFIGKTVIYNDGMIVVDSSKHRAENISKNEIYMNSLRTTFEEFIPNKQNNVYYVSQSENASDDNCGTKEQPFKTLKKACEIASAGDVVIIREGIYREVLSPVNNGTAGAPITFKSMEGENVIISAFDILEGFENVTEEDENYRDDVNLYKAPTYIDLGYTRNFILYNGKEIIQGRHPNCKTNDAAYSWPEAVTSPLWPTKGNIKVKSNYCNTPSHKDFRVYVSENDLNQDDDYWKGATFVGEIEGGWALTSGKIAYSTEGKMKLDNATMSFCWSVFGKTYGAFPSDYGYITDSIKTVDAPGEWHIENGYLYICPPSDETADNLSVEIKSRQNVINLARNSFINIENINTSGGGVCMDNSNMCVINGGNMKYVSHFIANNDTAQCFLDGSKEDWTSNPDNNLTKGELGICIGGTDCAVVNTEIEYSAAAGILLYGKYTYIENNVIKNTGYGGAYYSGIFCITEGYELKSTPRGGFYVYNNSIENTGRASFCMTSSDYSNEEKIKQGKYELDTTECDRGQYLPCEIAYNYFYNSNLIARDTGAYYIHGNNSGNDIEFTKLHHNIVCNVQGNDNTEDYFQPFSCASYFYDDAWVAGINEYNNVGFATNKRQKYTSNEPVTGGGVWFEMASNSNNIDAGIIPEGMSGMTPDDYPSNEPFFAGVIENNNRFLLNYSGNKNGGYDINAKDSYLSDGAVLENGRAILHNGEYAEFKNINIGYERNRLAIYYTGDKYNSPELLITVGNSEYTALPTCRGYDTTYECVYYMDIEETDICDIRVQKVSGGSFSLCGIDIIEDVIPQNGKRNYIICGEFDDFNTVSVVQKPLRRICRNQNLINSGNYSYAYNLFANPTLVYYDIGTDEFDCAEISFQLDKAYDGGAIELYMDSTETDPILTTGFNGTSWEEFQTLQIKLNKYYPAGTHNYFIKYIGKDGLMNSTMNLYYIRFYKEEPVRYNYVPDYRDVNFAVGTKEITSDGRLGNGNTINIIDNSDLSGATWGSAGYVQLDAGKKYALSRYEIKMQMRTDTYTLQASADGEIYVDIAVLKKEDAQLISGTGDDNTKDVYLFSGTYEKTDSYRYYRITGNRTAVINIFDVKLYATVLESIRGCSEVNLLENLDVTYTMNDGVYVTNEITRLYDNDLITSAIASDVEYIQLDLGNLYYVTAFKFVYEGRNNCGYKISASPDGINYDTIYFAPRLTSYERTYSGKIYIDRQKYQYIKIENINTSNETVKNTFFGVDLAVYGYDYIPDYCDVNFAVGTKEITSDGRLGNGNTINIIDNSDLSGAAWGSAGYVQLDAGRKYALSRYEIKMQMRTNTYTLQASADGESYVDIAVLKKEDAQLISGTGDDNTKDVYLFSGTYEKTDSYRYYRITGNRTGVINKFDVKLYATVLESIRGCSEVNLLENADITYTMNDGVSVTYDITRLYDHDLTTSAIAAGVEYIQLDLGQLYNVTAFEFVYEGRNNCGYKISASPDGINYHTIYFVPRLTSYERTYSGKIYIDRQKYQYIKIENINTSNETVKNVFFGSELSVYGLVNDRI